MSWFIPVVLAPSLIQHLSTLRRVPLWIMIAWPPYSYTGLKSDSVVPSWLRPFQLSHVPP